MAACEVLVECSMQIVKFFHSSEISDVKQITEEVLKLFNRGVGRGVSGNPLKY